LSEVVLSPDVICKRTGIHRTRIGMARQALVDYGLLLIRKEGRQHTYIVCDPERKVAVADRTSLKTIDFNHIPSSVLTKYIEAILENGKRTNEGIRGRCPLPKHNDTTPSFVMNVDQGGKWWCRGCNKFGSLIDLEIYLSEDSLGATIAADRAHRTVRDKLRALGMGKSAEGNLASPKDIVYSYVDEDGVVISEVVRRNGDKSKMYQRHPHPTRIGRYLKGTDGCSNVLYNLPQIIEAPTVIVVEGESDADRLSKLDLKDDLGDLVAVTTCRNGAGGWLPEHSETLRKKRVILLGDTDKRGKQHMLNVKASLEEAKVMALLHIELPPKYRDASHYLESHRPKHLVERINQTGETWLEPIEDDTTEI
jgi:5S rRNA maturation endonuclease (ribonuclease M5)